MQTCDDVSNSMSVYEERVIIHVCLESLVEPRLFLSPNIIISVIAFLVFVSVIYPLIYLSWSPEAHFNQYYPSQNPSSRNTSAVFPFLPDLPSDITILFSIFFSLANNEEYSKCREAGGTVVSNVFCLPTNYRKDVLPPTGKNKTNKHGESKIKVKFWVDSFIES